MAVTFVRLPHPVTLEGRTAREVPAGTTVRGLAAGLGDFVAAVDGRPVGADGLDDALPDGALVVARAAPAGGDDTNPLRTVLQVALLVASIYFPPLAGLGKLGTAVLTAGIVVGGNLVINAIAPPRLPSLTGSDAEAPEPVYSLTGGANRARPYQPLLLVLGTHRVFPDLAAKEYAVFESRLPAAGRGIAFTGIPPVPGSPGEWDLPSFASPRAGSPGGSVDQFLYQLFHFGLGDLRVADLRLGETPLSDLEEVETEFSAADGSIGLVAGNVDTAAGPLLDDAGWASRTTPADTVRIELDFTGRIFGVDASDGSAASHSVEILVEIRPDGGADDTVRASTVTLSSSSADAYRLTVPYPDLDAGVWQVRVRRRTAPTSESARTAAQEAQGTVLYDDVAWAALRSYQRDTASYAGQTRLGVRIRASGQLQGRLDRLSGTVSQLIPAWDGSAWVAEQASSNPAWLFRWYARGVFEGTDLLAGVGLPASRIDDDGLKAWGAWCDLHGLTCNAVLDRDMAHEEVLAAIAACGRASTSWSTGLLGVVFDQEDRDAVAYFGPQNIVAGSFESDWASGAVADEIVCRYVEPDADWQWNTVRRSVPRAAAANRSATLTLWGVTDRDQAAKACNLQAARQLYHKRRMRWQTGPEGLAVARGDVVHVSHALVDGGTTGRVLGGQRRHLELDRGIVVAAGDMMLLRLPDGTLHASAVTADPPVADGEAATRVRLATLLPEGKGVGADGSSPLDMLWRHYAAADPPLKAKVVAVEPQVPNLVRIEAIDEVAAYYAAATSDLTVDLPDLRRREPAVVRIDFAERLLEVGGGYAVELTATLTVEGDWRGGTVTAALDGGPARVVGRLSGQDLDATWQVPASGTVAVRAVPGSAAAPAGRALEVEHAIQGVLAPPGAVAEFSADGVPGGYALDWAASTDVDHAYTELFEAPYTADEALPADLAPRAREPGDTHTRLGAAAGARLRVWARHVDHGGRHGPVATADATPAEAAAGTPHFAEPVQQVEIRAVGRTVASASEYLPNPARAHFEFVDGEETKTVDVVGHVDGGDVTDSLQGADAAEFEIVPDDA